METNVTHSNLRRNIGLLGLFLPLILAVGNGFDIKPSISHFYYTDMGVVFTGVLWVFGLQLFSYKGYKENKVGDNLLTNLAGILIIVVSVIPTSCLPGECIAVNAHSNPVLNKIHLFSAGMFFVLMGWMSYFRFTQGLGTSARQKRLKVIYKVCGVFVWVSIGSLMLDIFLEVKLTEIDVFLGETIALFFFGSAWLIKSRSLRNLGL